MEEAFFNRDFWRQLVAVLVGAFLGGFLGFGGALATGAIVGRGRRQTLARMTRQIIVREAIDNLRALGQIDQLSETMRENGFDVVRISYLRPRGEILHQFMTAESLDALSEEEAKFLMVVTPQLAYLDERYAHYEQHLHNPMTEIARMKRQDGSEVPYREWATDGLLSDVARFGTNLLDILIQACHEAKGQLADDESTDIASKLDDLTFGDSANFRRAFKTSMVKGREDLDPKIWLVVWEHDWPECPMPVIGLRPSRD